MSFGFLASAVLAVLAQGVAVAKPPVAARWDVSWTDNRCNLAFIPNNDRDPAFSLQLTPGSDKSNLNIAGSRKVLGNPSRNFPELTLQLGPGLWTTTGPRSTARDMETNLTVLSFFRLDRTFLDQFANATELSVFAKQRPWIRIPLIGARKAVKVLQQCMDEKLVELGIDPKTLVGLRSFPVGNPTDLIPDKYKSKATTGAKIGGTMQTRSVHFVLTIAPDGRAEDCRIVGHSEQDKVEQMICSAMIGGQFQPAIGADGKPIRAPYVGSVLLVRDSA